MAASRVIDRIEDLDPYLAGWDELARLAGRPLCRPAWMLGWWRGRSEARPRSPGTLRVVVVVDADGLAAIAPGFVVGAGTPVPCYRLLADGSGWNLAPVLRPGASAETMAELARGLGLARPKAAWLAFGTVDAASPWPFALAEAWSPRGAWIHRTRSVASAVIEVRGSFDAWLESRNRRWRADYLRVRRRLLDSGAVIRRTTRVEEVEPDLASFVRLHQLRWEGRSLWLDSAVEAAVRAAALELLESGDLRVWLVEVDGRAIAAAIFAAAGGEVHYVASGFDRRAARHAPGFVAALAGIEEAFDGADSLVDLGYGGQPYKRLLADRERELATYRIVPRRKLYPLVRGALAARDMRRRLARPRMPPATS